MNRHARPRASEAWSRVRALPAVAVLLAGLAHGTAVAQPAGPAQLYEAPPPAGSAWLRFFNALPGEVALRPDFLPPRSIGTAPAQRPAPFVVVERVAGRRLTLEISAGGGSGRATLTVTPGSYNTVLLHAGPDGSPAATLVVDDAEFNRARARLSFYNAVPDCAAAGLRLGAGGPAVFEGVPALNARSRGVNPVTAEVVAACGAATAPPVALEGLEAGGTYSLWLVPGPAGVPLAFLQRDTTARRAP